MAISNRNRQTRQPQGESPSQIGLVFTVQRSEEGVYCGTASVGAGDGSRLLGFLMPSDEAGSIQWVDSIWRMLPDMVGSVLLKTTRSGVAILFDCATYAEFQEFMRQTGVPGIYEGEARQ